jgi:hypothetical protein
MVGYEFIARFENVGNHKHAIRNNTKMDHDMKNIPYHSNYNDIPNIYNWKSYNHI